MIKQSKIWGTTEKIASNGNFEVHRIEILQGGYCSEHKHIAKHNMFYVESGELEITQYNDNGINDVTVISDGEQTAVAPGVWHKFRAICDTIAYEIYWSEPIGEDIVRRSVGGVK